MNERQGLQLVDGADASIVRAPAGVMAALMLHGRYEVSCVGADGVEKWRDTIDNLVTDVGARHLLDNYLAGSSFSQVGPFLGLISSVGYAAGPAAGDTMTSHTGWAEAGNGTNYPLWTSPTSNARGTCTFAAAAGTSGAGNRSKALTAALAFTIGPTGGTVKGCFLVLGANAVATNNSTAGTLFSAGTFTGGDKVVAANDTLNVSWSLAI